MNTIKKTAIIVTVLGALVFAFNGFSNSDFLSERNVGNDFIRILVTISSFFTIVSEFFKRKSE